MVINLYKEYPDWESYQQDLAAEKEDWIASCKRDKRQRDIEYFLRTGKSKKGSGVFMNGL